MWARFNHGVRISTHARLGRAQGNLAQCRKVGLQSLHVQTQSVRRLDGISFAHCSAALSLSRTPADGLARQHAAAVALDGETTHSGEAGRSGVPLTRICVPDRNRCTCGRRVRSTAGAQGKRPRCGGLSVAQNDARRASDWDDALRCAVHPPAGHVQCRFVARQRDALSHAHDEVSGAYGGVDSLVRRMTRGKRARLPAAVPTQRQPKHSVGAAWPGRVPKLRTFGCNQMAHMCYLCWLHVSAILAMRYG
jgi:hypothetical protein